MRSRLLVVALAALAAGCASRPRTPGPRRAWTAALAAASTYAAENQFDAADSVLRGFVDAHPASPDTLDALFWRALYRADPANPADSSATDAQALVDRYLAAGGPQRMRYEALALRRFTELRLRPVEVRVDTVRVVDTAAVRAAVVREVTARDRVHDEEMQILRDSLARATGELERIRRRLARPRP